TPDRNPTTAGLSHPHASPMAQDGSATHDMPTPIACEPTCWVEYPSSGPRPNPRLLRGGTFNNQSANVRSANRNWNAPANRYTDSGFRPSSTWRGTADPSATPGSGRGCVRPGVCSQVQVVVPSRPASAGRPNDTLGPAGRVGQSTRRPRRAGRLPLISRGG